MSIVGFSLVVAASGSLTHSPITVIALMASGAAVIIIAFVRCRSCDSACATFLCSLTVLS
jgi:hypothetical protein